MSQRTEKVQRLARQVLGEEIQNLKDPRVGFVTVTAVRVSGDLQRARVFVSVLGSEEERADTMSGLESAKPRLRTELGRQVRMKYLPELIFELDHGPEEAEKLERALQKIHEQEENRVMDDLTGAVEVLSRAPHVSLATHVNPDGDALGSLFGASLALRKLGKTTSPSWGETPAAIPPAYTFLPGGDHLVQPSEMPKDGVFLALDCGGRDRLGELEHLVDSAGVVINVDHHPGNDNFGAHNIVVTTASSTAELIGGMLRRLDVEFDRDIATCLYTGIVTDTGRFSYSNSTPDTLRMAADLLELGVEAPRIATEVFDSAPFGYLKLSGRVLDRAVLLEEKSFVYSWITLADLAETRIATDETEKLIDLVRATRAADVAAMFKEQSDGRYRVSLRSKGLTNVGEIARANSGGGHDLAAGFTAESVTDAVAVISAALETI